MQGYMTVIEELGKIITSKELDNSLLRHENKKLKEKIELIEKEQKNERLSKIAEVQSRTSNKEFKEEWT